MSWNLQFELKSRSGAEVPERVRRMAGERLRAFVERAQHAGLAHFEPDAEAPLSGLIQILLRDGSESDYLSGVRELQSLARAEPDVVITAADEFYLCGEDVLEVDADQLLKPHASLRAVPDSAAGTFRRDVALNGQAVAREFLSVLEKQKLIEWCGDPQPTVQCIATLAERVGNGKWQGATAVLAILETDDAVAEVFATDSELDAIWRDTLNRA